LLLLHVISGSKAGDERYEQIHYDEVPSDVSVAEAKRGFVLLRRRWVVERTFAWLGRFRRLAGDYERLGTHLAGFHWLAAISIMLGQLVSILQSA